MSGYIELLGHEVWLDVHSLLAGSGVGNIEAPPLQDLIKCLCTSYPCTLCRNHFIAHIKKNGEHALVLNHPQLFMFTIHNSVNEMKGKPVQPVSILDQYQSSVYDDRRKLLRHFNTYSDRLNQLHDKYKKYKLNMKLISCYHHGQTF